MLCFEAIFALEAIRPDVFMMEDTHFVHLTTAVDTLHHPVCVEGKESG